MSLRRSPEALASALQMDRTLRQLVVEGRTDRLFLKWVSGERIVCQIYEIGHIEIPVESGGNRARAVGLADFLREELGSDHEALDRVRVLVDADFDHLDRKPATLPLVLTDGRSLESYFLRPSYFEKIFGLALMAEHVNPSQVYRTTLRISTTLAAVREIDRRRSLELPFQAQNVGRFVEVDKSGMPSLRSGDMLAELLRRAGLNASDAPEILASIDDLQEELNLRDPIEVVHGHDLAAVLGEIIQTLGHPRKQVDSLMRSTFERSHVSEYPVLSAIVDFAIAASFGTGRLISESVSEFQAENQI